MLSSDRILKNLIALRIGIESTLQSILLRTRDVYERILFDPFIKQRETHDPISVSYL